jgi:hypothetical protein
MHRTAHGAQVSSVCRGTSAPFAVLAGSTQDRKHVAVVLGIARLVRPRTEWLLMSRLAPCLFVTAECHIRQGPNKFRL